MIIAIQGFNRKKNEATKFAAQFADMLSMTHSNARTLLLQFLNNDEDNAEDMLRKDRVVTDLMAENEKTLPILEQSIDGFISTALNQKINNDLVSNYIKTISAIRGQQNRQVIRTMFDVMPISKNDNFVQNIEEDKASIEEILTSLSAERMYNYIIVVCDSKSEKLLETVNELADKSIYCLNQRFTKPSKVYGKDVYYVIPSYESDSAFNMKNIMNNYGFSKKTIIHKIESNSAMQDAAYEGQLHDFIVRNKDVSFQNRNYRWSEDLKKFVSAVTGESSESTDKLELHHYVNDIQDDAEIEEYKSDITIPEEDGEPPKKGGLFSLFKGSKKTNYKETIVDTDDEDIEYASENSVEEEIKEDDRAYPEEVYESIEDFDDLTTAEDDIELSDNELEKIGEAVSNTILEEIDLETMDEAETAVKDEPVVEADTSEEQSDETKKAPKKKSFFAKKKAKEAKVEERKTEIVADEVEVLTEEFEAPVEAEEIKRNAYEKKCFTSLKNNGVITQATSTKKVYTSVIC